MPLFKRVIKESFSDKLGKLRAKPEDTEEVLEHIKDMMISDNENTLVNDPKNAKKLSKKNEKTQQKIKKEKEIKQVVSDAEAQAQAEEKNQVTEKDQ